MLKFENKSLQIKEAEYFHLIYFDGFFPLKFDFACVQYEIIFCIVFAGAIFRMK